jgi:hypothetical protein
VFTWYGTPNTVLSKFIKKLDFFYLKMLPKLGAKSRGPWENNWPGFGVTAQ